MKVTDQTEATEELSVPVVTLNVISHTDEQSQIECPLSGDLGFIPDSVHVVLSNHYEVQTVPIKLVVKPCVRRSPQRSHTQDAVFACFTLKAKPVADRKLIEKTGSWRFSDANSYAVVDVNMEPLAIAIYRLKLNILFRGVTSKDPSKVLVWGKAGSGKTALIATLINIIHRHSDGNDIIDHSVISTQKPNPIIDYPSDLLHLMDTFSNMRTDLVGLMKTCQWIESKRSACHAIIFVIHIDRDFIDLLPEVQLGHDWALQVNKTPIVVLTHIEDKQEGILERAVVEMRKTFRHVVPIANYVDITRSTWTESAGAEILRIIRD
jgi:hypothetical protein